MPPAFSLKTSQFASCAHNDRGIPNKALCRLTINGRTALPLAFIVAPPRIHWKIPTIS